MTKRKNAIVAWRVLLMAFAVGSGLLKGCSVAPSLREINGSFSHGLEGWEVNPQDRASIVGEGRILNVTMSSSERVSLLKTVPLDPETELVKISFKVHYERGSVPWTKKRHPSYQLILQDPGTQGDGGYSGGGYLVKPWGDWETHEIVQVYRGKNTGAVRLRPHPKSLVMKIILNEKEGSFQFDDFRVTELVTVVTIEHR